jgi:hypothetical protein
MTTQLPPGQHLLDDEEDDGIMSDSDFPGIDEPEDEQTQANLTRIARSLNAKRSARAT